MYTVTLVASNPGACYKINDTTHLTIIVDTNFIRPGFTFKLLDSCSPYIAAFTNTSVDHSIGTPAYSWWFGDGTSYQGVTPPDHNYPDTGSYAVMLVMTDSTACISPDTVIQKVHFFNPVIFADFSIPDSICSGMPIVAQIKLTNVTKTIWKYGDGYDTNSFDPLHTYKNAGTYIVTLIAQNSSACKGSDTITQKITVLDAPTADFSYSPLTPALNVPSKFTNLSINANRYLWNFGDDSTSTVVNPTHQYNKSGFYKVCLTAYNSNDCPSVVCKGVPADIQPFLGLPTGFSPNGDGTNDILYVRGVGIKSIDLKIFNRWGQLVFETTNKEKGWDGKYNGEPQPIEVYAYVLNATFIDGTSKMIKGNVTLLK